MHEDIKEGSLLELVTPLCPWGEWIMPLVKGTKKDTRHNTGIILLSVLLQSLGIKRKNQTKNEIIRSCRKVTRDGQQQQTWISSEQIMSDQYNFLL